VFTYEQAVMTPF